MWDIKMARESLRRRHPEVTKLSSTRDGKSLRAAGEECLSIQQFSLSAIGTLILTCCGICFLFSACEMARVNIDRDPTSPATHTSAAPRDVPIELPYARHQDLLMGYTLLDDTLKDEGMLRALKVIKRVTFRFTVDEVAETMDKISASAKQRRAELRELRRSSPDVWGKPESTSPIGDAIGAMAKDAGTGEMLTTSIAFNMRFAVLQAQATRMVSAISLAVAAYEVNDERKAWLNELAVEYETYRDEIVEHIRSYVRGEGANQDAVRIYTR